MFPANWSTAIQPLLKAYRGKKHPLDYKNIYQLVVMVILSAQDSDKHINSIAPKFFENFPDIKSLSTASSDSLFPLLSSVRNFGNKVKWLTEMAKTIKDDENIPLTMDGLTVLPGIGRKSANVIMREAGKKAEGVIVDLHVVRVVPRLGLAEGTDPKKIEKQLMEKIAEKDWGEVGMSISFLGREICRPTPNCPECLMKNVCNYYHQVFLKQIEK